MIRRLFPEHGFANAVPASDPTLAMRMRIANMLWQARQRQLGALFLVLLAVLTIMPTVNPSEHDLSLPPASSATAHLQGDLTEYSILIKAEQDATNRQRTSSDPNQAAELRDELTAQQRDKVRFLLALNAREDSNPRLAAAELAAMQGGWTTVEDLRDRYVMRGLINFVRANDLTVPLPHAEALAIKDPNLTPEVNMAALQRDFGGQRRFGLLCLIAAAVSLLIGLRMARIATGYMAIAKRLG
ncbi:hypothetical protein [Novosphingobium sp. B 225]|uniref:hypothetical protein n=1 Tax=Novosphingobium sp. B 225 TaxID=1961849 RepID=UPI000B4B229C|nr:hypothetical protein [Novosphingobium sp. B 225]